MHDIRVIEPSNIFRFIFETTQHFAIFIHLIKLDRFNSNPALLFLVPRCIDHTHTTLPQPSFEPIAFDTRPLRLEYYRLPQTINLTPIKIEYHTISFLISKKRFY